MAIYFKINYLSKFPATRATTTIDERNTAVLSYKIYHIKLERYL
jgi:hypothetical protein